MATNDNEGLFGEAAQAAAATVAGDTKRQKGIDGERVVKLRPWDTVAAQLLNPYGPSTMNDMSLEGLWKASSEGSKKAAFHSELAAPMCSLHSWFMFGVQVLLPVPIVFVSKICRLACSRSPRLA